jgi:hypothetical protein
MTDVTIPRPIGPWSETRGGLPFPQDAWLRDAQPQGGQHSSVLSERVAPVNGGECYLTNDPDLIHKARVLTAQVYLHRGFITPDEIGPDGTMTDEADPHKAYSDYFVVTQEGSDGRTQVAATVRLIRFDPQKGEGSFPVLKHKAELDKDAVAAIEAQGVQNFVEVSALVRDKALDRDGTAAMRLYKELFLTVWSRDKTGDSALIMACNPKLYKNFSLLFDGSMKRIGPDLPYKGQDAIPAMFMNREGAINVIQLSTDPNNPYRSMHAKVVEYFFTGADAAMLHADVVEALEAHGYTSLVEKMRSGDWPLQDNLDARAQKEIKQAGVRGAIIAKMVSRKPEIIANVLLAGYTAFRTVAVAKGVDPVSETDWRAFLAVETWNTGALHVGSQRLAQGGREEGLPTLKKNIGVVSSWFSLRGTVCVPSGKWSNREFAERSRIGRNNDDWAVPWV